jgi:hypothetical protein
MKVIPLMSVWEIRIMRGLESNWPVRELVDFSGSLRYCLPILVLTCPSPSQMDIDCFDFCYLLQFCQVSQNCLLNAYPSSLSVT